MKGALLTLGLLSAPLTGCAANESYSRALQPWIGATADQLERVWGPPAGDRVDADGQRTYTYVQSRVYSVPMGSSNQDRVIRLTCETNFYFSQGGAIERIAGRGSLCDHADKPTLASRPPP